jgi:glycosyltransferase involved in cell wall biosynthesis
MRILIVVPQQDHASGNWATARRFQQGLEKIGHRVVTLEIKLQREASFQGKVVDFAPDVALLLHAYRSGKPWLENARDLMIPTVVMLTGTDVNHGLDDPQQSDIIQAVIEQAVFVILQNPIIATALSRNRPTLATRLKTIPPGVILGHGIFDLRATLGVSQKLPLFLMPAGLRPVKAAIGLLKIFDQLGARGDPFHLAFCGPVLDEDYGRQFRAEIATRPWASYLGVIPPEAMAGAMRSADVIINNSISEGLANSLLEAATLGIPMLARNNPGNAALVRHDVNGLLYDDDNSCLRHANRLLEKEYRQQLSRPDPSYNPDMEAKALEAILAEAVSHRPKTQIIASSG